MTCETPPETSFASPAAGARLGDEVAQLYDLFDGGLRACSVYWIACLSAHSPADILQANAVLAAESCNLAGVAAGLRQTFHGRLAPTLNEA